MKCQHFTCHACPEPYTFRGGYIEDAAGDRWWSSGLLAKVEKERDEARVEVERLRGVVERLQQHYAELVRISCLSVAERQREACAKQAGTWSTAAGDAVRATPLVTEGEEP